MKYLLSFLFFCLAVSLYAQDSNKYILNHGLTGSVFYLPGTYSKGHGIGIDFGIANEITVGKRRRGRIGLGLNFRLQNTKNQYENNLRIRNGFSQPRPDSTLDLRAGSFSTRIVVLSIPVSYRFVFDGKRSWSLGFSYRPGLVIASSAQNSYVQYDFVYSDRARVNQTDEVTESSQVETLTDAATIDFAIQVGEFDVGAHFGIMNWQYSDDYIGGEQRLIAGMSLRKWLGR